MVASLYATRGLRYSRGVSDVQREVFVPATPDEIWPEITEAEKLGDWFGADVDGDLQKGEVATFNFPDGSSRRAVVEEVDPPKRLTFRWLGDDPSRVEIECDEVPDGSIVRVVERQVEAAVTPQPQIGFKALARATV